MSNKLCSIIVRTKNEERWISSCLDAISNQSFNNFEIIIVDNNSTDKTLEKAKQYNIKKIVKIKEYLPGKALNIGIEKSNGEYIVCISAHCIPKDNYWLKNLVSALEESDQYAGVYGRQEPMSFSSPADKRDLMLVFGLDRKTQVKDSFFHNANSIFRRDLWEEVPFDAETTNIEDRLWAQKMLNIGYKILYEPDAIVYHYHGIHQDGNHVRLTNVVRIIQDLNSDTSHTGKIEGKKLKIIAVIPVRGNSKIINKIPLITHTIESTKESEYIDRIIVSTDSEKTAEFARAAGAEVPFMRPSYLSESHINLESVQRYSLEQIEVDGYIPDLFIHLEETYPFRTAGLLDGMIDRLLQDGFDSVIAARREPGFLWQEKPDGSYTQLDSGDIPRQYKEKTFVGIHGLGVVTHPEFIRNKQLVGNKVGLYKIDNPLLASFEVRDKTSIDIASKLLLRSS